MLTELVLVAVVVPLFVWFTITGRMCRSVGGIVGTSTVHGCRPELRGYPRPEYRNTLTELSRLSVATGVVNDTWVPALELAVSSDSRSGAKGRRHGVEGDVDHCEELVVPMPSSATMERWLTELGVRPTDADQLRRCPC